MTETNGANGSGLRRKAGEGGLIRMKGSPFWWLKWQDATGRTHRESAKTTDREAAEKLLVKRVAQAKAGVLAGPSLERVRFEEVAQDLRDYYATTGKRDPQEVAKRLKPLLAFFAGRRVRSIGPADVTAYVKSRKTPIVVPAEERDSPPRVKPGKGNGTINRELGVLNKMLRLAHRNKKLAQVPVVELLAEPKARAGFFERVQYEKVRENLRPDLQVATDIAYTLGWRVRDEVLTLTWPQVNLKALTLRLEPGTTKNKDGRLVPLRHFPRLVAALHEQRARVEALEKKLGRVIPEVFPHLDCQSLYGAHETHDGSCRVKRPELVGTPVRGFKRAWKTACKRAGLPAKLLHDFRRTAVRNMERAGVPRSVAMAITGHRTESVYRRYAIVDERSIGEGTAKLAAFHESQAASQSNVVPLRSSSDEEDSVARVAASAAR
jgi:integrase